MVVVVEAGAEEGARETVRGSRGPRICAGARVSSRVPGGWIGSYSEVASVPASFKMIFAPPGCESRKSARENSPPLAVLAPCAYGTIE